MFVPGYYWPQPWYPYPPAPFGYGQPMPPSAEQTGQMPAIPIAPGLPPQGLELFPPPLPLPPHPEELGFDELTRAERVHWRVDFKWVFGIVTALLLFAALASAGLYRTTGSGASKGLLLPLLEKATEVREKVKDSYKDLREEAALKKLTTFTIPGIGYELAFQGKQIVDLGSEGLADRVIVAMEKMIYTDGYTETLPMSDPRGVGEERAKAGIATVLATLNGKTHRNLVWPLAIFGGLALIFGIIFIMFCRGWGRVTGPGILLIATTLPTSLFLRAGGELLWSPGAGGAYKGTIYECLRGASSLMVVYFDIALGLGALVLLVGVIGGAIARGSRKRVAPFEELSVAEKTEGREEEMEEPVPPLLPI